MWGMVSFKTVPVPTRPPRVALNVKIQQHTKRVVDQHAALRGRSQAMASDELLLLGAAAYALVTGETSLRTFQETVALIGVPMALPRATEPDPPPPSTTGKPYVPREERRQRRRAAQLTRPAFIPPTP